MNEITVQELKEKKESGDDFLLLDVREDFEYLVSNLEGLHVPMDHLENRMDELEEYKQKEVIVMCRSGNRSAKVTAYLQNKGFEKAINLKGGIKKWADEIDGSMPVA